MKFKSYYICYLLFLGLSGCMSPKELDETFKPIYELDVPIFYYYYTHDSHWPASITELKSFCSQDQNCPSIGWEKYKFTHLETLPDGSLRVKSCIVEDLNKPPDGNKPNIILTIPKPTKLEDGNSFNYKK